MLCGADTEKIRKFGHQTLSTYNIGGEHSRAEWGAIGRELVRLGLLFQNAEKFNIVELTDAGRAALKARQKITLTKPVAPTEPAKHRAGEIACDEALFEKLRGLRKQLADERAVPPYIVFSDVSLRQMARFYPANEQEFSRISGVGEGSCANSAAFSCAKSRRICRRTRARFSPTILPQSADAVRSDGAPFAADGHGARDAAFFPAGQDGFRNRANPRLQRRHRFTAISKQRCSPARPIDVNALVSADAQQEIAAAFPEIRLWQSRSAWWNRSAANTATANAASSAPRCSEVGRSFSCLTSNYRRSRI